LLACATLLIFSLRRRFEDLERENKRLQAENADLRRDNRDLRDSALMWTRLYERAIERAQGRRMSHPPTSSRPPSMM
jgi:cell division protein FtsB